MGRPRCPGQAKVLLAAPDGSPRSPRPVSFPPPSAPRIVRVILVGPAATPLRGSAPWGRTEKSGCAGGPTHPRKRRTAAGRPLLSGSVPQWGGEEDCLVSSFPDATRVPSLLAAPVKILGQFQFRFKPRASWVIDKVSGAPMGFLLGIWAYPCPGVSTLPSGPLAFEDGAPLKAFPGFFNKRSNWGPRQPA